MNITPWEMYWILKLDDVRAAILPFGILPLIFGSLGLLAIGIVCAIQADRECWARTRPSWSETWQKIRGTVLKYSILSGLAIFLGLGVILLRAAVPSTKQMAAIYLVPKIASSDFVSKDLPKEGRELYELMKQWIKIQTKGDPNDRAHYERDPA